MQAHLAKYWEAVLSSYWFVPTLMTIAAFALSFLTTVIDESIATPRAGGLAWLSVNTPDSARALLSTIAGSMITVAGVTFSITIVVVVFASSQLGPRLLGNFMRDSGNQITLGTFISTFVYGLLILRTVHGVEDGGQREEFVPHVGLLVALCLALASIGVLIYFIHHVPLSIQASQVIAQVGRELTGKVDTMFPSRIGEPSPASTHPAEPEADGGLGPSVPVEAGDTGYITHLDADSLLDIARAHDLVIRLVRRPGDFVSEGEPLAFLYGGGEKAEELSRHATRHFALDVERTPAQDIEFLIQELVEIAARALSPSVNDPFTAIGCINWLGSFLSELGERECPSRFRYDREGHLRVIAPGVTFAEAASEVFDQLRPYVSRDRNAALHALSVIEETLEQVTHAPYRAILLAHAEALTSAARAELGDPRDVEQIAADHARITRRCACSERVPGVSRTS